MFSAGIKTESNVIIGFETDPTIRSDALRKSHSFLFGVINYRCSSEPQYTTDHMLIVSFDPETGWSSPEIKPYGPLSLDPASSCFQYCPNVFEGTKVYPKSDRRKLYST